MRRAITIVSVGLLGVCAGLIVTPRPVPAAEADPLEKRVAELERVVLHDAYRPDASVVDRLAKLEKSLSLAGPGDVKTPDDLKKAVLQLQSSNDALDRRLKALETRKPGEASDADRDVRELQRSVQEHAKSIKDLETRVHRLELK